MRLPIIKQLVQSGEYDEDYMEEAIEVLLCISEARGVKDEELEVIGELISNIAGGQEVLRKIKKGTPQKEALNEFMKQVVNSVNN